MIAAISDEDQQGLAIGLEPRRLLHEAPLQRVADRGEHRDLDADP